MDKAILKKFAIESRQDLMSKINTCHIVFGSGFGCRTLDMLEDKNIQYFDFMKDKLRDL